MDYISRVPSPPLDAYIYDLYYLDGLSPYPRLKVSPDPALQLMINVGPAFPMQGPDPAVPVVTGTESWWIGLRDTYLIVDWSKPVQFYGVHFKPAGGYPFLGIPSSELRNQIVPGDAIWGHFAVELRERLLAAPTVQDGLALLEQCLLARLAEALHGLEVVQYAVAQIDRSQGAVSIRVLSDHIGISQNHLLTQFKRMVGVSPKDVARVVRFAHVIYALDPTQDVDWGRIARQTRYYDLSHLNKDFVEFTGHNPTEYLRLRTRFASEHPGHALDVGPFPVD